MIFSKSVLYINGSADLYIGVPGIDKVYLPIHFRNTLREKGSYLTQFYDKSPYTHRKIQKASCK